jgi:hypothetical protein
MLQGYFKQSMGFPATYLYIDSLTRAMCTGVFFRYLNGVVKTSIARANGQSEATISANVVEYAFKVFIKNHTPAVMAF